MIFIKTDELNYLIYRYFLEQGLSHTAFSLHNEAGLQQFQSKYQDEVRPGHLINLLEKALLFQQIEDHVHMNQVYECNEKHQLIEKHVCQFTERKAHSMRQEAREKEIMVSSALNRSQEFQNHGSSLASTMDKFWTEEELFKAIDFIQLNDNEEIQLSTWNPVRSTLGTYHPQINCVRLLHCEGGKSVGGFRTIHIIPTYIGEQFQRLRLIKWDKAHGNNLLLLYENGVIIIADGNCQIIKMFTIKNVHRVRRISWNKNWPNIAAVVFDNQIEIIDVFKCSTLRVVDNVRGFYWRFYDQFIAIDQDFYIKLFQVDQEQPLLILKAEMETSKIEFNSSKTLLASFSGAYNTIKVWTLQSDQYIFEIQDDQKIVNFCWCSSQNANYLITQTNSSLNIWDVEFGVIKCTYKIDVGIVSLHSLDLLGESPYIVLTTTENKLLVYDLINRKRKIVQLSRLPKRIIKMNEDEVLLLFPTTICILNVKTFESD